MRGRRAKSIVYQFQDWGESRRREYSEYLELAGRKRAAVLLGVLVVLATTYVIYYWSPDPLQYGVLPLRELRMPVENVSALPVARLRENGVYKGWGSYVYVDLYPFLREAEVAGLARVFEALKSHAALLSHFLFGRALWI